jgi:hypothetical protein
MIFASISESSFYDPIRVRATSKDTLLGVINGVQVEVGGVGGDAVDQLHAQNLIPVGKGKEEWRRKKEKSKRRKEEEGKETHERILKVLVCPKPPFHP